MSNTDYYNGKGVFHKSIRFSFRFILDAVLFGRSNNHQIDWVWAIARVFKL